MPLVPSIQMLYIDGWRGVEGEERRFGFRERMRLCVQHVELYVENKVKEIEDVVRP